MPAIRALGASFVAVSPQNAKHTLSTAEKRTLEFPVLSDVGNLVAKSYGLVFTVSIAMREILSGFGLDLSAINGDASAELPVPATFVIASNGRVDHAFVNADYRTRLEPADVLRRLERLQKAS